MNRSGLAFQITPCRKQSIHTLIQAVFCLMITVHASAQAGVIPGKGAYVENHTDLRIKVLGGHISIQREWGDDGEWHFNRNWHDLEVKRPLPDALIEKGRQKGWVGYDSMKNPIIGISRSGSKFTKQPRPPRRKTSALANTSITTNEDSSTN